MLNLFPYRTAVVLLFSTLTAAKHINYITLKRRENRTTCVIYIKFILHCHGPYSPVQFWQQQVTSPTQKVDSPTSQTLVAKSATPHVDWNPRTSASIVGECTRITMSKAGTVSRTVLHVAVACCCTSCCNSFSMKGSSSRCSRGCCRKASVARHPSASCAPVAACSVHDSENYAGLRHSELAYKLREGERGPHLTQSRLGRGLPPYQVTSWSLQPFGRNRYGPKIGGLCPSRRGGAGSPPNTMWPGTRPTCLPSFVLIRPIVWPQCTNVKTGQDRQTDRQTGQTSNGPIA